MIVQKSMKIESGVRLFNLKWVVQDRDLDYEDLGDCQYFNHFQNNKEITSKSFLKKNLSSYFDPSIEVSTFFPRCYDFASPKEIKEFKKDYFENSALIILRKNIKIIKKKLGKSKMKELKLWHSSQPQKRDILKDRVFFPSSKAEVKIWLI